LEILDHLVLKVLVVKMVPREKLEASDLLRKLEYKEP